MRRDTSNQAVTLLKETTQYLLEASGLKAIKATDDGLMPDAETISAWYDLLGVEQQYRADQLAKKRRRVIAMLKTRKAADTAALWSKQHDFPSILAELTDAVAVVQTHWLYTKIPNIAVVRVLIALAVSGIIPEG